MKQTFFNRMPIDNQQHFIKVSMRAGQSRLHIARCLGTDLAGLARIEAWKPEGETETHQVETKEHQPVPNAHQAEIAKPEPKFVKVRIPVIHSRPAAQQPDAAPADAGQAVDDMGGEPNGIDDEDDEDEMPARKGRPRGWLITAAEMNEIYAPLGGAQAYKGR